MRIGTAGAGGGRMSASSNEKNSLAALVGSPLKSPRSATRDASCVGPGGGVDPADLDLVAVFAADANPEDQPPRRALGQGGDLAGDRHGVAQRQR